MADTQNKNGFGQKMDWLKSTLGVTDGEIGAYVGASASLVCRWRKGQRGLDRVRDKNALDKLAEFFIYRAEQTGQRGLLAGVLNEDCGDVKNDAHRAALIDFLYNASPIPCKIKEKSRDVTLSVRQECYFGITGLLDALKFLEQRANGVPIGIAVYLSLEHSRLVHEDEAGKLWEALWSLGGGNPVRLVFDNWTDATEAMKTLRGLLPFMQAGRLHLNLIKSTQKFFYSNISFYAAGIGIIVTTDPAGGYGGSVSMLVESSDYVNGMGDVFARFDKNTKPVEKHLCMSATRDETSYYGQLFKPGSDLKTIIDGASLLYMDVDAYMKLLKLNGITGSQRAYRLDRFVKDKHRFEEFLKTNRTTEILSLYAFDKMIKAQKINTPDFSFCTGVIKADKEILTGIIAGMTDYLERYENLSIYLNRRKMRYNDFSCRLKGDRFILLHSYGDNQPHAVWSDTWLLVYEYIRQYEETMMDADLVTTKDAVLTALRMRLDSVGGLAI